MTAAPLRRRLRLRALHGLTRASALLPAGLTQGVLDGGAALARFSRVEKRSLENLELALGTQTTLAERKRIARGVRRHSARLFAEFMKLARQGTDLRDPEGGQWIEEEVVLDESIARLHELHERGRGVLILTAHLGNWEYLSARLHRLGLDGVVVGRHRQQDGSSDWLSAMRKNYGVTTHAQDASPRDLLRVLSRGETIGMLADLEVRRLDSVFVPFFGTPALTMTAPAALARARKIPILPARCIARSEDRRSGYTLRFEEPLALRQELGKEEALSDLVRRLSETYERWIRETPEQWAWFGAKWRTRPGERVNVPLAEVRRRQAEKRRKSEER